MIEDLFLEYIVVFKENFATVESYTIIMNQDSEL